MSEYQVIARKFRPQTFKDVYGQDPIVTTLKNALKHKRLAQAYLFCGSRGTGKTTLARLLAKALNCMEITSDLEPCGQCSSCREIASGNSLDVIEIDGASHRGIEDIRQINENVGYASAGNYKIYIIDEVHMLTKEAFNALLKTLEEPPLKVKFFFATTEPHKVLPTILSRCQRFNLNRIPLSSIIAKLRKIADELKVETDDEALRLLAQRAEGGLRDAESLFDQILAFEEGSITADSVSAILGLMPSDIYFDIDSAGKSGQFAKAFEIAHRVFSEGKDITFFIEGLIDHLRLILLIKVSGIHSSFIGLADTEKARYAQAAALYSREQCLDLIEYLLEAQQKIRTSAFVKISLEALLLHVMRSHFRIPIEQLVHHLSELEKAISNNGENTVSSPSSSSSSTLTHSPSPSPSPSLSQKPSSESQVVTNKFVSEDPTPSRADFGKKKQAAQKPEPAIQHAIKTHKDAPKETLKETPKETAKTIAEPVSNKEQRPLHEYDTLMHFAAVELEGRLQKN